MEQRRQLGTLRLLDPRAPAALAALLVMAGVAPAQAVHEVPGDFSSIQDAVDASVPGDVVLVHGGLHEGPLTIDRPLTLLGDPRPSIAPPFVSGSIQPPAIRLAGSGTGRVVLCNVAVGGPVNGLSTSTSSAGIQGGGFDELYIVDCTVDGPLWVLLTGVAIGSPAVRTDVADVLVERSTLRGADSANDGCYGNGPPGAAGIDAPSSNVVVLDSSVRGGGSQSVCGFGDCPIGGTGGPGIVADYLRDGASEIQGGSGAIYFSDAGATEPCGAAPDGAPFQVVRRMPLGGQLVSANRPRVGQLWRLSWSTSGSYSVLLVGDEMRLTPLVTPSGPLFLDLGNVFVTHSLPAASGSLAVWIPPDASLLGRELVAQARGQSSGWTRPLVEIVRPPRVPHHQGR